ncbi:unnamed protein product [Phaeothamnion confervicola]
MAAERWGLTGQTALVTGGTKGIGKAITTELATLGARVLICARSEEGLEEAQREWKSAGLEIHAVKADVGISEERSALLAKANDLFAGNLSILVNNVGNNVKRKTVDYTDGEFHEMMNINFGSVYQLTRAAHPLLKSAGHSSVVNISSVAGVAAISSESAYAAAKASLNHMTSYLGCEWAKDGIRVNAICPWFTNTPLVAPVLRDAATMAGVLRRTPLGRIAQPEEVSALAAFLCMQPASYVTAQVICVDGERLLCKEGLGSVAYSVALAVPARMVVAARMVAAVAAMAQLPVRREWWWRWRTAGVAVLVVS